MNGKARTLLIATAVVGVMAASLFIPDWKSHVSETTPAGEHWSLLVQFLPGLTHNIHSLISGQKTYIGHEQPDRISHMIMAALVVLLAVGLALLVNKRLSRNPPLVPDRRFSAFVFAEGLCEAVLSLMEGVMGEKNARRYFPLIGSLALFILLSNLIGMIPGFVSPTDTLDTTLALGGLVFVTTHVLGVREHGIGYFKHFLGPIIKWYAVPLMALIFVIEMISHFVRPCSLAMRLMGNIMGDHKVVAIFLSFGILLVPLPIMALGLIVAVVQTLVFSLLSIVYIALAIEHSEEH
jgi:F-type H+-transporting ATPase subunit a